MRYRGPWRTRRGARLADRRGWIDQAGNHKPATAWSTALPAPRPSLLLSAPAAACLTASPSGPRAISTGTD